MEDKIKFKNWIIGFGIGLAIFLAINNIISIGHNHRMIDMFEEHQEFIANCLHETIHTQGNIILRIQGVENER